MKKWSLGTLTSYNLKRLSQKLHCYLSLTFDSKFPILFHVSSDHSVLLQLTFFMFSQICFFNFRISLSSKEKSLQDLLSQIYANRSIWLYLLVFFLKFEFHYSKERNMSSMFEMFCLSKPLFKNFLVGCYKIIGDLMKPRHSNP